MSAQTEGPIGQINPQPDPLAMNPPQENKPEAEEKAKANPGVRTEARRETQPRIILSKAGTITFRPIEVRFEQNKNVNQEMISKMKPYCKFKIGGKTERTPEGQPEGDYHHWGPKQSVILQVKQDQYAELKLKDNIPFKIDPVLGKARIPLVEIFEKGGYTDWIYLQKGYDYVGKIQIEVSFHPDFRYQKDEAKENDGAKVSNIIAGTTSVIGAIGTIVSLASAFK